MTATSSRLRSGPARADLAIGLNHHRAGRFTDAQGCYLRVLGADPRNPDAHHLLGLLALGRGALGDAGGHFARLVALRPRVAEYRSNYGHTLRMMGDLIQAERELGQATTIDPSFADGWINLGLVRLDQGDPAGAVAALEMAVAKAPQSALAQLNLGSALQRIGRLDDAALRFARTIALAPDLAPAHKNLGVTVQQLGRFSEAVTHYRHALALVPDDPDVLTNLGLALTRLGDLLPALQVHDRAVMVAPHLADVWLNRGTTLQMLGRLVEARASFARAQIIDPGPKPHTALGSIAAEQGDFAEATIEHERAVGADPDFGDAHWNFALALLGSGEVTRGWDEYEWRWRASSRPADFRRYLRPVWQGEPLNGKRILVWREQGLGDELMFLSCVPDLLATGAIVTLLVSPRLVTLVRRAFPGADVLPDDTGSGQAVEFDCHLPLGSLPRRLRPTRASFPPQGDYLEADPAQVAKWRDRLAQLGPGRKVGICWRSGLLTPERRRHYAPLDAWAPVWRVPGVVWINLQYDDCEGDLTVIEAAARSRIHRWAGEDLKGDLESVAGLITSLDAVVTAPTVVSSIAGAVGTRAWQLDSGSDWTALGEDRSPWSPSVRLIRKGAGEAGWEAATERLAATLRHWVGDPGETG